MALILDLLIAGILVGVAGRALFAREAFTGAMLYVAFGLLMSLAWARLRAPDIALAEAAIGAGLTGALLIDATRRHTHEQARTSVVPMMFVIAPGLLVAAGLLTTILRVQPAEGLTAAAAAALDASGIEHPVTAVLLNFRAYDTWLETGVLLLAVLAAYTVSRSHAAGAASAPRDVLIDRMLALLIPMLVLVSGLLIWLGTRAPGGAFQAGAVLASGVVLLMIVSRWSAPAAPSGLHRLLLGVGFGVFLMVGVASMALGGTFLELRGTVTGPAILLIEVALTISIAAALALLFAAARSAPPAGP